MSIMEKVCWSLVVVCLVLAFADSSNWVLYMINAVTFVLSSFVFKLIRLTL